MKTYTGHEIATINFEFHGEERTVDLATEAMLDLENLSWELEHADAKRVYWESVLSKLRLKAKRADIDGKRAEDNVKHVDHMIREHVLQEAIDKGDKKPSDKVLESKAKSSLEYKNAQEDVHRCQEIAAEKWETVDAVEGLVKALRSEKGRTDALHFFLNREGLKRAGTGEGGRENYQKRKKGKEKEEE